LLLYPQQSECKRGVSDLSQDRSAGRRKVLRCCRKTVSDGAEVRCAGRLFQRMAVETGKVRLSTVVRL